MSRTPAELPDDRPDSQWPYHLSDKMGRPPRTVRTFRFGRIAQVSSEGQGDRRRRPHDPDGNRCAPGPSASFVEDADATAKAPGISRFIKRPWGEDPEIWKKKRGSIPGRINQFHIGTDDYTTVPFDKGRTAFSQKPPLPSTSFPTHGVFCAVSGQNFFGYRGWGTGWDLLRDWFTP